MKKTAIVSCYFIHNYGSILQAYATQKVLDKLEVENETVNVSAFLKDLRKAQYSYIIKSGITSGIFCDRLGKAKNLLVKKFIKNQYTKSIGQRDIQFDAFNKKFMRLSETYSSLNELAQRCGDHYNTVLIGSDQLWLPANIAANYYTLNFVPDHVNTVAYATSFGVSSLPDDALRMAAEFLPRIRHISVREEAGSKLIKSITGRSVPVVCDPTLLFTGEEWMDIQQKKPIVKDPYIFCYFIGNAEEHRNFAVRLKKKTGYKIVAIPHVDHYMKSDKDYADETPYAAGPSEFLNLIRNAAYVCTDSFHCSVFSILYRKEFFVFRRYLQNTNQSTNSRIDTLFNITGINNRLLSGNEKIDSCMAIKTDYDAVHEKLEVIRASSYEYLASALNDERSTDLD